MTRIWATDCTQHVGSRVHLAGWLHHQRRLSQITFLVLRDGKGTVQVVVQDPAVRAYIASVRQESVLSIEGVVCENPQAPRGVEVHDPTIVVLASADVSPPLDLSRPTLKSTLPTILDHAPVALRHPRARAPFEIASATMAGFRATLTAMGFIEIQTPKIVSAATESGANLFAVDYFGRPAYLAQSPQLYKQIMVGVFERVFEVGPVFRAEPHDTPRHLSEYVSLDAEMGFIIDHTTVMPVVQQVVDAMVAAVRTTAVGAVDILRIALPEVPMAIPAIHFSDAQRLLLQETGEDMRGQDDLAPQHERWLGAWARQTHGSDFLFVTGYPAAKRPFYTHPDPTRPQFTNSFDLLFRGVEISTGGQRVHRYEDYVMALRSRGIPVDSVSGYLEAFRCGMPPHGGFAIGLERWVAGLVGAKNVRETTLFPRDRQRLTP